MNNNLSGKEQKYSKILNNLLDIQRGDKSLFTTIRNIYVFDIIKKFGKEAAEKILNNQSFSIVLKETDLINLISEIKSENDGENIISLMKKYN